MIIINSISFLTLVVVTLILRAITEGWLVDMRIVLIQFLIGSLILFTIEGIAQLVKVLLNKFSTK